MREPKELTKFMKGKSGITLIALVITIIVLLILAGISIMMLTGDNSILNQAANAKTNTIEGSEKEAIIVAYHGVLTTDLGSVEEGPDFQDKLQAELTKNGQKATVSNNGKTITYDNGNVYTLDIKSGKVEKEGPKEPVPLTTSYVGYYADFEADGTIDGVIYADLAQENTGSGQWADEDGVYTIPTVTEGLKGYYISKTDYEGDFGTKDVLSPTGTGVDRFYVMALKDIDGQRNGTHYHWYYSANGQMNDWETNTSRDFGTGKTNTSTMITKWDAKGYGEQDKGSYKDLWGQIKTQVGKGWFVPSKEEWSAFAEKLGINDSNYADFNLSDYYWSSSQFDAYGAWSALFDNGYMNSGHALENRCVRLSTTF